MRQTHWFFEWSLLGMLASSSLAVASSGLLEAPSIAVALAILLRGAKLAGWIRLEIPDAAFSVSAILLAGFWALDYAYFSRDLLQATLRLAGFLAAAMIVRARTGRDYFFVKLVALMQLVAAGVLQAGLMFLLCFAAFAVFGLAAQTSGEIRTNMDPPARVARSGSFAISRRLAALTACVLAAILSLGGALFLVLPRTASAALQGLGRAGVRLPGFASEIRLGEIGQIRMTSTPVLHARIDGPPREWALKWRGSALANFDGKRWFNPPSAGERIDVEGRSFQPADRQQLFRQGLRISYEVQLKNVSTDVLFFAGIPESVGIEARAVFRTPVDSFRLPGGGARGARYEVYRAFLPNDEHPSRNPAAALSEADRRRYLQVPAVDPRVAELARSLTANALARLAKARAIEHYLRTTFPYAIEPMEEVDDPVAHFLFERKKGHCEYFSSSMAVMLRSIEIPSRVATGFQSGTFNPMSGWHLVRSSDAHSWVEAFLDGYGWVTFDPTPPDPGARAVTWLSRAGLYLDAADVLWQEWVVNYDIERQLALVDRVGRGGRAGAWDWWELTPLPRPDLRAVDWGAARWLAAGLALLLAIWRFAPRLHSWWESRRREQLLRAGRGNASDASILYERMLAELRRRGVEKPAWMTPREFAECVTGPEAALVGEFTHGYLAFRFGGRAEEAPRLLALVEALEAGGARPEL